MDTGDVIAIAAVVIALASLALTVYQAAADRRHKRLSVEPHLILTTSWRVHERAGIRLQNVGLGPARITKTEFWQNGNLLGEFDKSTVDRLREHMPVRPSATTWFARTILPTDYDEYILFVKNYEPTIHGPFIDQVRKTLNVVIHYESLYGVAGKPARLRPPPTESSSS